MIDIEEAKINMDASIIPFWISVFSGKQTLLVDGWMYLFVCSWTLCGWTNSFLSAHVLSVCDCYEVMKFMWLYEEYSFTKMKG